MWKFITLTAAIVFLSSVARSQSVTDPDTHSNTSTVIPTTTGKTETTGLPVSTTKIPASTLPDTTTKLPVTTTKLPVTTTKLPVTTTSVELSTTTKPDTSTAPVTTEAPEPIPTPTLGSWNVTDHDKNTTCIRAEMKALFTIPVNDKNIYIALSPKASDDESQCDGGNNTQVLNLIDTNYNLVVEFEKDGSQSYVKNITFKYNIDGFQGSGSSSNSSKFFNVKIGNSYICNTVKNISLDNITLTLSDLHIQAFGAKDNTGFGTAEECDADDIVSNIVPIAVGCALAALIIVVLIAYLVGRRRNRQKGYQSVY